MEFGTVGIARSQEEFWWAPVLRWAKDRGISGATLAAMNAGPGMAFFPDLERKTPALFFKYPAGHKARSVYKKSFVSGGGFKLAFWNIEQVLRAHPARVYVTEGELDALALVEAGISPESVLSVPNGANATPAEDPREQAGYSYVVDALKNTALSQVKEFVWCGDGDDAGRALRTDFARLIGAARMRFMEWPEGIKDANEMLLKDGAEALVDLVQNGTLPWPVAGIYRIAELPEPPPFTLWQPGFEEWESKVRLAPGTMSVLTGQPGHGKTVLFSQIWFQIAKKYGITIAMAMFETHPRRTLLRHFRSWYHGELEKNLSAAQIVEADDFVNSHFIFLVPDGHEPNLNWFLDKMEVACVRHNCKVGMLDPWNRLEGAKEKGESETDYIGRCLRAVHGFSQDFQVHMQIVAHPSKTEGPQRNQPPMLQDISGSKHWDNMPDQGFVVHRPKMYEGKERRTEAILLVRKVRFQPEMGYPCKLDLRFDDKKARFVSRDYEL